MATAYPLLGTVAPGKLGREAEDFAEAIHPGAEPNRPGSLKTYIVRVLSEAGQPPGPREIELRPIFNTSKS